jgi:MFS family permease
MRGAGMFTWFRELSQQERRAFYAAAGGWAMDAMDYMVFTFVIATLIKIWGIDRGQAGLLGTVTLLVSAFGGWIAGMLADRYGRVRVLQISILWFATFTFLNGFAQNFGMLFATRALQGLGFGGEWAVGSVLVGEIVRAQHRGKAVGAVQSTWAIGWGLAAVIYSIAFSVLPEEYAWRTMFWIGILPALLVIYIRRYVSEPPVFTETQKLATENRVSVWEIFSPSLVRTTVLTSLLATGAQGGYYAITTWLPTYLKTVRHLSVLGTGGYLSVIIIGSFIGYLVSAYLNDVIGRRRNFFLFAVGSALISVVYTLVEITDAQMLILGFPLGFFASGIFSGMGPFLTELFPSRVRGTGQGFAYNFGRGIGALFPTLVGYLSGTLSLGAAIGIFAVSAYALVIIAALLLPETKGRVLKAYD